MQYEAEILMNYPGYSNEEIAKIVSYAISYDNCEQARRRYAEEYNKEAPPVRTIRDWKKRFLETLSVLPKRRGSDQNEHKVRDVLKNEIVGAMGDGSCTSQRHAAQRFRVSLGAVNKILKESNMKPFKYTLVHQLNEDDFEKRLTFCNYVIQKQLLDPRWHHKIIFSDEATFHLNGIINRHNCNYYSQNNEHRTMIKPLKSSSITVWAMIPYDGRVRFRILRETMNHERYCDILREIVIPSLTSNRYIHHYYQQDGASVHWALAVRELLNTHLQHRWIGRSGPTEWPPRSPDLTINDFWLWSFMRDRVFIEPRPATLQQLADRCENVFNHIDHNMVRNCFSNFLERCHMCIQQHGHHIEQNM